jgi:hypothetical protein
LARCLGIHRNHEAAEATSVSPHANLDRCPSPLEVETSRGFSHHESMQRAWYLTFAAAGAAAVGLWALVSRLRREAQRRDLGTISEAWLSDPRSYPHSNE